MIKVNIVRFILIEYFIFMHDMKLFMIFYIIIVFYFKDIIIQIYQTTLSLLFNHIFIKYLQYKFQKNHYSNLNMY